MVLAALFFHTRDTALLLVVLFPMGLHSTTFGPIKYAILPQALAPAELVGGNGLVEMGTQLAMLVGMIAGNSLMLVAGTGNGARPEVQLEPHERDRTRAWHRATRSGGVQCGAGHLLVLVLRHRTDRPAAQLHARDARRRWLGQHAGAHAVLDRHRRRCAAVRADVGPARGDRPGATGRVRPDRVRRGPVLRAARRGAGAGAR